MNKDDIVGIVKTFELSPKVHDFVLRVALERVEERSLSSFDAVYEDIAFLVERCQIPWEERHALRLDHAKDEDDKRRLLDRIGEEDQSLVRVVEGALVDNRTFQEAFHRLERQAPGDFLEVMKRVFAEVSDCYFYDSMEVKQIDPQEVMRRAEKVFGTYLRNGILQIARRPVVAVELEPIVKITFGRRRRGEGKFDGDPLGFFLKHRVHYGEDITRRELYHRDRTLAQALNEERQMDAAIPLVGVVKAFAEGLSVERIDARMPPKYKLWLRKERGDPLTADEERYLYHYKGFPSALEYYKAHPELHGYTRSDLVKFGRGIYNELSKQSSLDEAIAFAQAKNTEENV